MLKMYRKKMGYTQEELAEILDMSWRQLQRIKNGKSKPSLLTLKKLVIVLNISDDDLAKYIKSLYQKN